MPSNTDNPPKCELTECTSPVSWSKWNRKWNRFCSRQCTSANNARVGLAKRKATSIAKYGVEHPAQSAEVKSKTVITQTAKYNGHSSSLNETKEKAKCTYMKRYGVENISQLESVKEQKRNTHRAATGFDYHMQSHLTADIISKLNSTEWLSNQNKTKTIHQIANELGVSVTACYKAFDRHNIIKDTHFDGRSLIERELADFIKANTPHQVVTNTRDIISGEIDIYIPFLKLGFEINGAYWHSENKGRGKYFHLTKTENAVNAGIQLVHIFDYEYYQSPDIIKSMILHYLGQSIRVFARKTKLRTLSTVEERNFFNSNHKQGYFPSLSCYGLFVDNQLRCAMSFCKSRYNKNYEHELLRFANCINHVVVGGASKLFSHHTKTNTGSVISYSDKLFSQGNLYTSLGFKFLHSTSPSYFYTRDYKKFENRVKFQKHKLSNVLEQFDPNLTEWQNMQANGYDRIWNCGNGVWEFDK